MSTVSGVNALREPVVELNLLLELQEELL